MTFKIGSPWAETNKEPPIVGNLDSVGKPMNNVDIWAGKEGRGADPPFSPFTKT